MNIKSTGKALALSVFLHLIALAILLNEFGFSSEPKLSKKIDHSSQKSTERITHATLVPEVAVKNDASIAQANTSQKPRNSEQQIQTQQTIQPSETYTHAIPSEYPIGLLKASKYYSNEEDLEPAQPLGNWVLETNAMLPGRVYQIFIQIWILETGEFEKFELIESSLNDEIARLATLNILQTPMAPATQDGIPVASTRKLVILIDKDE
jgi:hypothetical protein